MIRILTKKKQNECLHQLWKLQKLIRKLPTEDYIKAQDILPDLVFSVCGFEGLHFVAHRIERELENDD